MLSLWCFHLNGSHLVTTATMTSIAKITAKQGSITYTLYTCVIQIDSRSIGKIYRILKTITHSLAINSKLLVSQFGNEYILLLTRLIILPRSNHNTTDSYQSAANDRQIYEGGLWTVSTLGLVRTC